MIDHSMPRWKRQLRRIPLLRRLTLRYFRDARKRQHDIAFQYHQSAMSLIGSMTVHWAGIDLIVSHVIAWHKQHTDPSNMFFPRDTTRKISYFKDYVEKDARISDADRATIRLLRIEFTRLNGLRKDLVHGQLYQRNRRSVDWQVHLWKPVGSKLVTSTKTVSNDDLLKCLHDMTSLASAMGPFFANLIGLQSENRP